jgi:hypothetical protein
MQLPADLFSRKTNEINSSAKRVRLGLLTGHTVAGVTSQMSSYAELPAGTPSSKCHSFSITLDRESVSE